MKTKLLLPLIAIAIFVVPSMAQSVAITGRKVTYKRPKPIADYKKTFTVNYPRVKASTPALSRKIETAVSYQTVAKLNVREELTEVQWLEEADYEVKYNKNRILCIELSVTGSGAYPSSYSNIAVVDLKTGTRLKAADLFTNLNGLSALVRKDQKQEIADSVAEIKKDPEGKDSNPESFFTDSNFKVKNLEAFEVSDKGITFIYDYGFPHAYLAYEPDGHFFYAWNDLKPFIKAGGLLGRFVR